MKERFCAFRDCRNSAVGVSQYCPFHRPDDERRESLHRSGLQRAAHRAFELAQLEHGSHDRYALALAGVLRHWFGPEAVLVAKAAARHLGG